MKKIIAVLLAVILCFSLFSFAICAADNIGVLKAGRVAAEIGEEITVPVTLEKHKGVCIIRVTLKYDAKVLEYKGHEETESNKFGYTVNDQNDGEVIVLMDSKQLRNVEGDITLFKLKFKVKKNASTGNSLIKVICEEGMATYFVTKDGKIEPSSFVPSVSTGAVTILCSNHEFVLNEADNTSKCSKCGVIKTADGSVSVDVNEELPEIDVPDVTVSESPSSQTEPDVSSATENSVDGNTKKGVKFVYFIPLIAAVLIIGSTIFIVKTKKNVHKS